MEETEIAQNRQPQRHWVRNGLIVLVIVLGMVLFGAHLLGKRSLALAAGRARALGPTTLAELENKRRSWPAEQDAGPVFAKLAQTMNDEEQARTPEQREALKPVPLIGERELSPVGHLWNEADADAARQHLRESAELLEQLDGLRAYAGGKLPLAIAENPLATLLLELRPMRRACKLECLAIMQAAMTGRVEDLGERIEVTTRLRQMIDDQPVLISALVAIATDVLVCDTLERALGLDAVRPEDLGLLSEALSQRKPHASVKMGLLGERAMFIETGELVRKGKLSGSQLGGCGVNVPNTLLYARVPLGNAVFAFDVAHGTRMYNTLTAAADDPEKLLAAAKLMEQDLQNAPTWAVFTRMMVPSLSRAVEHSMQSEAQLRATRIGLAIEQYRIEHNAFPETLEALTPAYMRQVPADPFSGQTMQYRQTPEGVVVYSVGIDRQDDGGQPKHLRNTGNYDTGFRVLAPAHRRQAPVVETQPETNSGPNWRGN